MVWWKAAVGAAIVLVAIREMFNDLFHPTRSGALSEWIAGRLFRVFRRWPSMLATSGPLSMVMVIFTWAILLALGFGFIYWSVFPEAYAVRTQTQPSGADGWWWSLYYSLEMMTTLGLGDLQPNPTWLKLLSAFHALIGFSFVTASITWIVLVFPALRRTRTLARKANTLDDSERQTGVPVVSPGMHMVIGALAEAVIQSRVDLIHFPLLFYFYAPDDRASLPCALLPLWRFAMDGKQPDCDRLVRLTAKSLETAVRDLAELLADRLDLKDRTPENTMRAYVELHRPAA